MIFYPTIWAGGLRRDMPQRAYLLPATSWARFIRRDGTIRPANLPAHISGCAIDPGAFQAAQRGGYPYTFSQYLKWILSFHKGQIAWVGMPDYCCAFPEQQPDRRSWFWQLGDGDFVRAQQLRTTFMAEMVWSAHQEMPFAWVPVVQGLNVDHYVQHARDLRRLIEDMQLFYGTESAFRVGIGSLARPLRQGELHDIILAVAEVLPDIQFHLFGIKLGTFRRMKEALPECVASTDSTVWHGQRTLIRQPDGSHIKAWQVSGRSQLGYAYNESLPIYEQAIAAELAKLRPRQLPWREQDASCWWSHPELLALLTAWREEIAERPYPDAFLVQLPSPLDAWFWP